LRAECQLAVFTKGHLMSIKIRSEIIEGNSRFPHNLLKRFSDVEWKTSDLFKAGLNLRYFFILLWQFQNVNNSSMVSRQKKLLGELLKA
jgi:hypothetical protein